MLLSEISIQQYGSIKGADSFWDSIIKEILIQEEFSPSDIKRFHYGANIVYSFGGSQYVIKLYPKHQNGQFTRELEVLTNLEGKIKLVETPRLVNFGSFQGWNFLIMTQLKGELLIDIWDQLTNEEKTNLSIDLGKTIKEFHEVPIVGLKNLQIDWKDFIQNQYKNMKTYHQELGVKESLLADLERYVEQKYINTDPAKKLLTGEYTPFNLLVNKRDGNWKLTGVIDFADCFLGDADYDLLGPILFMFNSNQSLIQHFLESYGLQNYQLTDTFQKKLMTYTILHRFSDVNYFTSQNYKANKARNFKELAKILFPIY
ncbi:aminoglycoside 3'-phosphotransferase/choline kinase family protein [Neobacillus pocheonensis]|uniref:phosphotransferase n=1 Tax=Neobacillus pocheonensis TaxID=363869 RepID=UPI003D26EEF5